MYTQPNFSDLARKIRKLPFDDALDLVFKSFHRKKEQVAKAAYFDTRNIYRYLNGESLPQKQTTVKMLIAMALPYEISMALLYSAGYSLNASAADVFYRTLLENPGAVTIIEANEMIDELNVTAKNKSDFIPPFKLS